MYEAKLSSMPADPVDETGAMRALEWGELAARLSAARDLRRVLAEARGDSQASFAAGAAHALAPRRPAQAGSKGSVNPDALGAGKSPCANTVAAAGGVGDCDREMR